MGAWDDALQNTDLNYGQLFSTRHDKPESHHHIRVYLTPCLALAQNSQKAAVPYGCSLQPINFLVELGNDAVQLRDPLLIAQRRSFLHILVLSHQVGLLTLQQRSKEIERVLWTAAGRSGTSVECTTLWFSYSSNQQCLSKKKGQTQNTHRYMHVGSCNIRGTDKLCSVLSLFVFFLKKSCHFCLKKTPTICNSK